jgi:hypothetical protein
MVTLDIERVAGYPATLWLFGAADRIRTGDVQLGKFLNGPRNLCQAIPYDTLGLASASQVDVGTKTSSDARAGFWAGLYRRRFGAGPHVGFAEHAPGVGRVRSRGPLGLALPIAAPAGLTCPWVPGTSTLSPRSSASVGCCAGQARPRVTPRFASCACYVWPPDHGGARAQALRLGDTANGWCPRGDSNTRHAV